MIMLGERIAAEALVLVGTPFRLQGRDPATGLDCIGLVALAIRRAQGSALVSTPRTYRLRNSTIDHFLPFAASAGLQLAHGPILPGDVLHTSPGPAQDHLLIALDAERQVHAHAGLRRVVLSAGPLADRVLHLWRAS